MNEHLRDLYRGATAFLLCGGPSLQRATIYNWNERGILTVAVNHAALVIRPNVFICSDPPDRFHDRIWRDPGIMKLFPVEYACRMLRMQHEGRIESGTGVFPYDCPNAHAYHSDFYFDHTVEGVRSDKIMRGPYEGKACSLGIMGGRSVMIPAIHLLVLMGVRRIVIVGADFKMDATRPYAFGESRTPGQIDDNNKLFGIVQQRIMAMCRSMADLGVRIQNADAVDTAIMLLDEKIRFGCDRIIEDGWYYPTTTEPEACIEPPSCPSSPTPPTSTKPTN